MPNPICILLADDFTGACDTGLQFVRAGLSARVQMSGTPEPVSDILVWDTETRNSAPRAAADRVTRAARQLAGHTGCIWYKKVDSTLRGPIGAEIDALMTATDCSLCLLAPALPGAGRTTVGGVHYVDGVPVHRTAAGRDPGAPVTRSSIAELVAQTSSLGTAVLPLSAVRAGVESVAARLAGLPGPTVAIADAAEPKDLQIVAAAAARLAEPPLLCGCAGLAANVPGAFGLVSLTPCPPPPDASGSLLLVVAGSAHPTTARQLGYLRQLLQVRDAGIGSDGDPVGAAGLAGDGSAGSAAVSILSVRRGEAHPDGAIEAMARVARRISQESNLSGIAVTGGATALALLTELEAGAVDVLEAVGAEAPLCRLADGPRAGLPLVTKGGGLGEEDIFVRAARRLVSDLI